jgi:hypothetical protein
MNLQTWDLGEIIKNHAYVREIYPTNLKEKCLFSSSDFLRKLVKIYNNLGIKWSESQEMNIRVKLPDNPNPVYRDNWNITKIKKANERPSIKKIDRFSRYYDKQVVFASNAWMGEYETFPGDEIIITPIPTFNRNYIL